jgi:NAD(P)-dependent dehydrogenase (short-subunit alcohol dehydrogenase family)
VRERVVVITAASDGIGKAAARILQQQGAHIVLVGRSAEKTRDAARELNAPYYLADFSQLDEVRRLAEQLAADLPRIDVLANNAGGIMGARQLTVDGNERTFQVNHLAPFLLTNLLLRTLISSHASVINTSSIANKNAGPLDLEDPNLETTYSPQLAYSNTKLMNILFTRELHRRFHAETVAAAAFHPGVVRTGFATEFSNSWSLFYRSPLRYLLRSPAMGADTLVWWQTPRREKTGSRASSISTDGLPRRRRKPMTWHWVAIFGNSPPV